MPENKTKTKTKKSRLKSDTKNLKKTLNNNSLKKSKKNNYKTSKNVKHNKTSVVKKPKKDYQAIIFGVVGVLALIVIILAVIFLRPKTSSTITFNGKIAAEVNGVQITMEQLNNQYNLLPPQYQAKLNKTVVLDQIINEDLIIDYGKENGFTATPEQINAEIQSILTKGNTTIDDFQQNLMKFNLSFDDFKELIKRKLIIGQAMDKIFADVKKPTEDELRAYYNQNLDLFKVPKQVKVRHILIRSQVNNSAQLARDVMNRVKKGADFCALVTNYSDDTSSKNNCGEYTFPRGTMVPQFENASFDLKPGEVTVVNTQYGYHVLEKLADIPATTKSFDEVKDQLADSLSKNIEMKTFQTFLANAKSNATIKIYYKE